MTSRKSVYICILFAALGIAGSAAFSSTFAHIADNYNATIFGNLYATQGDTEGRLFVSGNATYPNSYSVGTAVIGEILPPDPTRDDLIVGGDLSTSATTQWNGWSVNANAVIGGSIIPPAGYPDGGGVSHINGSTRFDSNITLDPLTGNVPADDSGSTISEFRAEMHRQADIISGLEDRGVVKKEIEFSTLILEGNDPELNVFTVTQAMWNDVDWLSRHISAPAGSTVIINISGTDVTIGGGSMTVEGVTKADVLVNFTEATSLFSSSLAFDSHIMAMSLETATFNGGAVNGKAILTGDITQQNGWEFHNFGYGSNLDATLTSIVAPEPASMTLLCLGGLILRRRRNW